MNPSTLLVCVCMVECGRYRYNLYIYILYDIWFRGGGRRGRRGGGGKRGGGEEGGGGGKGGRGVALQSHC